MVYLKCCRKECGYVWDYKGRNNYNAKCPLCITSVSIRKNMLKGQSNDTKKN